MTAVFVIYQDDKVLSCVADVHGHSDAVNLYWRRAGAWVADKVCELGTAEADVNDHLGGIFFGKPVQRVQLKDLSTLGGETFMGVMVIG